MSSNPYQSPMTTELASAIELSDHQLSEPKPLKILFKWTLVCIASAGPSFFWGCIISDAKPQQIAAMLLGISAFIVAYTSAECTPYFQRVMRNRLIRRTAKIGYGTRIGLSIFFPLGIYVDLFVGMISVSITESIFPNSLGMDTTESGTFFGYFGTTILQGLLLNAILFVYMLVVYAIARAVSPRNTAARSPAASLPKASPRDRPNLNP